MASLALLILHCRLLTYSLQFRRLLVSMHGFVPLDPRRRISASKLLSLPTKRMVVGRTHDSVIPFLDKLVHKKPARSGRGRSRRMAHCRLKWAKKDTSAIVLRDVNSKETAPSYMDSAYCCLWRAS